MVWLWLLTQVILRFQQVLKIFGGGIFISHSFGSPSQTLTIVPFNDFYKEDYLINDSSDGYFIFPYKNNTFNYVEGSVNEQGSFEIIEVDGKKYIIDFSDEFINDENDFSGYL